MLRRTTVTAAIVATCVVAVAGCSRAADPTTTSADASPTSVAPATPEPATPSDEPTTESTTAQPSATTAAPTPTSPSPTAPGPTASSAPTATPGAWPKAIGEPQQGDPVWGVYLQVAHATTDPAIETARRQAASVGYQAVVGDLACDGGATEALRLDQYDYWAVASVYFATEAQARTFVASYTATVAKPRGLAKVTVGCLD